MSKKINKNMGPNFFNLIIFWSKVPHFIHAQEDTALLEYDGLSEKKQG